MSLPSDQWSVEELLKRCARRPPEHAAWCEFVRRFHPTIRLQVSRTFHSKARQEVERKPLLPEDLVDDLVQGVYLKLVEDGGRALERFEGEHDNSIYQYIAMIAVNVVRDHFREIRAQKRPKVSISLDQLIENGGEAALSCRPVAGPAAQPVNGIGLTVASEEIDRVLNRVVKGKNRDRDLLIFKLRYYEGLTLEEIARVLGFVISPVSVGSILNRIVRKLKPLMRPRALGR
jgi:RNA polymerase sigma factor (sigma-70 family)